MKAKTVFGNLLVAVVLCVIVLPVYGQPTPEQIKERTNLLIKAIEQNNIEQAKVCVKLGADVNAGVSVINSPGYRNHNSIGYRNHYTMLGYAVKNGSEEIVRLLLDAGAEVDLINLVGYGNKNMMKLFIEAGADVNAVDMNNESVLMRAIWLKDAEIVELLINAGADVNVKSNYIDETALKSAVLVEQKEIVELLVNAGADVNASGEDERLGDTPFTRSLSSNNLNNGIAEYLVKAGADVNVKSKDGKTALIQAAIRGEKYIVEFLIRFGADVNAKDNEGITALTYAILYGNNDIATLLKAAGAKE